MLQEHRQGVGCLMKTLLIRKFRAQRYIYHDVVDLWFGEESVFFTNILSILAILFHTTNSTTYFNMLYLALNGVKVCNVLYIVLSAVTCTENEDENEDEKRRVKSEEYPSDYIQHRSSYAETDDALFLPLKLFYLYCASFSNNEARLCKLQLWGIIIQKYYNLAPENLT